MDCLITDKNERKKGGHNKVLRGDRTLSAYVVTTSGGDMSMTILGSADADVLKTVIMPMRQDTSIAKPSLLPPIL